MANTTVQTGATPAPKSLASRASSASSRRRERPTNPSWRTPKWFGMLALTTLVIVVLVGGFMITKVGQDAWLDAVDQIARASPSSSYQGMEKIVPFRRLRHGRVDADLHAADRRGHRLGHPVRDLQRRDGRERDVQAGASTVVVHAGPIGVLGQLFTVPLNYVRGTMTSATNLVRAAPVVRWTRRRSSAGSWG